VRAQTENIQTRLILPAALHTLMGHGLLVFDCCVKGLLDIIITHRFIKDYPQLKQFGNTFNSKNRGQNCRLTKNKIMQGFYKDVFFMFIV
jgi:hypothetical protein